MLTLFKYNLDPPDKKLIINSLEVVIGREKSLILWAELCVKNGVIENKITLNDLELILIEISEKSGILGICGRSLLIRFLTYKNIKDSDEC